MFPTFPRHSSPETPLRPAMIPRSLILILSMIAGQFHFHALTTAAEEPLKPSVEKLDGNLCRIGQVTFDTKTREIRFPAKVNMTEGLLEFLVVTENGKTHESLLSSTIIPTDLNLAFTLLRYPVSKERTPLPNETGGTSNNYPDVPPHIRQGARVTIEVEWLESGKTRRLSANDMIRHDVKTTAMPPDPWIYGGSDVFDGKFVADSTGDLIAVFEAPSAILNASGEDSRDDTVWVPYPKRVPALATSVTIIIKPYHKDTAKP
jgi:hypothetical protein